MNEILTIDQVAEKFSVAKQTIYDWVHRGKIPYFKMGRHLRFDYFEVLEHFKASSRNQQSTAHSRLRKFGSLTTEEKKRGNLTKGGRYGDL